MGKPKKDWREFEKLVSRIEKLLSPEGAVVKSPDRLIDKFSGQTREVDASIRYTVGSVNVLITIECRKRKAISDDTWIEQLATKKQKIGASDTIAVSSTHFTEPAIKSARLCGIELRVIRTISDEDILSWMSRITLTNVTLQAELKEFRVKVYDPDPDSQLDPSVISAIKEKKMRAMIFFSEGDNKKVSIADIFEFSGKVSSAEREGISKTDTIEKFVLKPGDSFSLGLMPPTLLDDDVPDNGLGINKIIELDFREGGLSIQTVKGPKYVQKLGLNLVLAKVVEEIPISRKVQYATTEETVSNVAEADIELFKHDQRKSFTLSYSGSKEGEPVIVILSNNQVVDESDSV
jgi:hypothetical protein